MGISYNCQACNVSFNSQKKLDTHCQTVKHRNNSNTNRNEGEGFFEKLNSIYNKLKKVENDNQILRVDFKEEQDKQERILKDHEKNYRNQTKDFEKIRRENEYLRKKIEKLEKTKKSDIICSYNGNNSVNMIDSNLKVEVVKIRKLGQEDLDYISEKMALKIMMSQGVFTRNAAKIVHFNPNYPQNTNVRMNNKNSDIMQAFNGSEWVSHRKTKVLEQIVENLFSNFEENYGESFKEKYGSRQFYKFWVQRVESITDTENSKHKDNMRKEIDTIDLLVQDESHKMKVKRKRRIIKAKVMAESKYLLHVFEYDREQKRRNDEETKCIEKGLDVPEYKPIETHVQNYVNDKFDYEKFEKEYVEPSEDDPRFSR